MKKDKEFSLKELENVNGGSRMPGGNVQCPQCNQYFNAESYTYTRGSGCDKEHYKKCPHCGYEFDRIS